MARKWGKLGSTLVELLGVLEQVMVMQSDREMVEASECWKELLMDLSKG